jgi:DNA-binding transcriptional LysR family regulator
LQNVTREHLAEHVLLTVRGSDPRLQLATAELDTQSTVHLPDFHSKKAAIVAGIGFGWLPDWLIEKELARKELVPLRMPRGPASGDRRRRPQGDLSERIETVHVFEPRVSIRGRLGLAGDALLGELLNPLK